MSTRVDREFSNECLLQTAAAQREAAELQNQRDLAIQLEQTACNFVQCRPSYCLNPDFVDAQHAQASTCMQKNGEMRKWRTSCFTHRMNMWAAWTQRNDCRSPLVELDLTASTDILVNTIRIPLSLRALTYLSCVVIMQVLLSTQETLNIMHLRSWLGEKGLRNLSALDPTDPCTALYLILGDIWKSIHGKWAVDTAPRNHSARSVGHGNDVVAEPLLRLRDLVIRSHAWTAARDLNSSRDGLRRWVKDNPVGAWLRVGLSWTTSTVTYVS